MHSNLHRLGGSILAPQEPSQWELEKQIAENNEANRHLLLDLAEHVKTEIALRASKHAESQTAKIRMCSDEQKVVLEISDAGKGIDPSRLQNRGNGVLGLGVGITGMRERVRQLGGTLEIEPANPGTLVRAIFPLGGEKDGNAESIGGG